MENKEDTGSPGWGASFFMQTTGKAVAAAAAAATAVHSPRPSVVFSTKDDSGNHLQKLQRQVSRVLKGLSQPPESKTGVYNPEILTSQKRQWAKSFQLQSLDHHKILKEPSRLFESMVVIGLHPSCDIMALQHLYFGRKSEGSSIFKNALGQHQSRVEPNLEPQVLFVYPPEKQLPIKYRDLLSFCFPAGVEVHAVERTPSMSELNEILIGQEHLKQSDLSFVFRLQAYADDSTLYGCCVLVDEIIQRPSGLVSMISDVQPTQLPLSRHILTTRRCYCILSRIPCFELHFGVLNSIFTEERLERLTKSIGDLDAEFPVESGNSENLDETSCSISPENREDSMLSGNVEISHSSISDSIPSKGINEEFLDSQLEPLNQEGDISAGVDVAVVNDPVTLKFPSEKESFVAAQMSEVCDTLVDDRANSKQISQRRVPSTVLPLLRHQHNESSESSSSIQFSTSEDRNLRSDADDTELEEASFSGQSSDHQSSSNGDILDWAKENNHGSLQIISEYYQLPCPARGSTVKFHPLEHLHPLEYQRPDETVLHIGGSTIDLKSCSTGLEMAEAYHALMAEEEATALSVQAVASLCGSLRLEHVLTFFAGALLEKQIVFVCSNLGILSASVLSIIPLLRPYQWQSLLMPVLPNDMLDFLDAPVPYIVGVKNKTTEVQSKLTNALIVDVNKNQVKSQTIPQLPKQKELFSLLSPYHQKLVGESYLGRRRPIYEYTDVQAEAAKGFLSVLRSYLESLCSNLRSHTITNVQSNDDKVSLLLKESFIESFASRDRPFMRLFLDTQMFSVHTDLVLSFFQKE
ncbi:hypothetical protein DCAR_0313507 [Daucus carota subsp. sativus]|uniref:UDENN domain-containing protein n=2 Tax=Daucus carota subsp. sativus TaxID=79200 RepID=A0AAF1AT69_DAUCS|nr:PREDICTED: uncharacterized protein LOC108214721 [Daucus carota subsp. sativus]WOG94214.1 hypothetical protein DCAR_0313507 [Daucus carota subsp. sativus]